MAIVRREAILTICALVLGGIRGSYAAQATADADLWMADLLDTRALVNPLRFSRFADPIYFLISPIGWRPNSGQTNYLPVTVPIGFVTDLTSIPRVFWSALRPDGDYAYAAIVHDFLYWEQARPREEADVIFKLAMEDLDVRPEVVALIYEAVHRFGDEAWESNARLKKGGERRILVKVPDDPTVRWNDWKKRPDVF